MRSTLERDVDRFYSLLTRLSGSMFQGRTLSESHGRSCKWPNRGIYFFFEPGEFRVEPDALRIVRVGTHAVGAGAKSTLWGRLRAHRGGKDGGGNHRGSIFRLHVGAALLAAHGSSLPTWGKGMNASRSV